MTLPDDLIHLLQECGAPLATFVLGLFFPQVRLAQLLDVFRPHSHDGDQKKG